MKTVLDLTALKPREFKFTHEGETVVWEWTPLTAEQVEAARAAFTAPKPPMKNVDGGTKDLAVRQSKGLPIAYEDWTDPEYEAAMKRRQDSVALEMVRIALGWDMDRDAFHDAMRTRLPYGVVEELVRAVTSASFSIDFAEVERNLGPSSPSTGTGVDSSTPTGS